MPPQREMINVVPFLVGGRMANYVTRNGSRAYMPISIVAFYILQYCIYTLEMR